ncbi:MAG: response regulator [Deltaproteobacteria bacterium]
MKILAIDDNRDNLLTLKALLTMYLPEATLSSSLSAVEGIERARAENPDVILLDIQMPEVDGFEATTRLKGDPELRHIPIILLTAHRSDSSIKAKGLEYGADAFLSKPLDEIELMAQIKAMVRIKRSEDALRQEGEKLEAQLAERTSELLRTNEELNRHLKSMHEKEGRYRRAVQGSNDGLWDWNMLTDEYYISPRWKELIGFSIDELPHKKESFFSRLHPDDEQSVEAALQSHHVQKKPFDIEFRLRTKSDDFRWFRSRGQAEWDERGNAVLMAGSLMDVTERRLLEEQLLQSQKMEAIGQLAGGVAHDFNNILQVIMGFSSVLTMSSRLSNDEKEAVDQIVGASTRAAQLTHGLLAFSRKQIITPWKCDLNEIVTYVHKIIERVLGEDIHIKLLLCNDELPVSADSVQIEQVLMNLGTNARDAMPKGGTLTIETGFQEIYAQLELTHGSCEPGLYAWFSMSDTGEGIDRETQKRIFEPFFTTKEVGKGTGLGMAIVFGIVTQHKGFLNVYSEIGQGTTFRIYLPLASSEHLVQDKEKKMIAPPKGTETILLAEDDIAVRKLMTSVLTEYGYKVIQAENGEDAVEKFAANSEAIHMLLFDMIMPKKNGMEASLEIKRLKPDIKVLYSSGYTADFMGDRGISDEGIELIMKPVQPLELLKKIRVILDR